MPYTPPSHRSPASSTSNSPDVSRRSSHTGQRPTLPRSASYLSKHRRTPSVTAVSDGSASPLTPQATEEDLPAMMALATSAGSVRQSPPPKGDETGMPKGAVISPPDSASSGSDDEGPAIRGRDARDVDRLKDLRIAVSQIPQPRTPSPVDDERKDSPKRAPTPAGLRFSFSATALEDLPSGSTGRKISHVRSSTEPSATFSKSADNSLSVSEEEDETDEDGKKKPQMVRKKSGELVRPALRPPSRRRPSSMPGTPIFSKAVHFDSHLEHVRHFLQVDRPLAVSAGSSPVDSYESDSEYPFSSDEKSGTRSPPYEWEILTSNFPHDAAIRNALPVKLEKLWLSPDQKSLLGSVAVANLAFQKMITCRFTLDYWKTTSEITAEYSHEIRPQQTPLPHDRFTFSIKLADTANLESKTLFLCVRYTVNGQEYWDNNHGANFQVDFRKKHLPQNGKGHFQGAASKRLNGLPRSNHRRQTQTIVPRPKSMPVGFDEFAQDEKLNFDQPIHEYLGETGTNGLRLKTRSSRNLASDNISNGLSSPSGVAFANRYDFGASLSAAVQAAKDSSTRDRDHLYMKDGVRGNTSPPMAQPSPQPTTTSNQPGPGTASPSLPSSSYEELVNKYCFFGSRQTSPVINDGTLNSGRFDGPGSADEAPAKHAASKPTGNQVLQLSSKSQVPAPKELNPYFQVVMSGGPHGGSSPDSFTLASDRSGASPMKLTGSARSSPPPLASGNPSPAAEVPYHLQNMLPERFPWVGDAHTPAAIRG